MNRLTAPAAMFATAAVTALAWSQTPSSAPNINTKIYFTTPLEKDDTRVVRLESATFPPHEGNDFHRHSGEQWTAIQEGEIALTIRGQAPRTLRPGDSAYIPRGTVHRNQNLTDRPARLLQLNIMDKDKPWVEPAAGTD